MKIAMGSCFWHKLHFGSQNCTTLGKWSHGRGEGEWIGQESVEKVGGMHGLRAKRTTQISPADAHARGLMNSGEIINSCYEMLGNKAKWTDVASLYIQTRS